MASHLSRKEFLRKAGMAIGASIVLPNAGFPSVIIPKQKEKLGIALVGLGYYSSGLLAPALQQTKHCELKGIVTGTPAKIPRWQSMFGIEDKNVYNYENMHQIANNEDIDVLYIVTPSGLHAKYAIKAAEAGKNVWCEKPMETTVERCQQIINTAVNNKVQLTIGYRMQHEPNTQTLIKYSTDKPFGKIRELTADAGFRANHAPDNWRANAEFGGGAVFDMGVYCINAARYCTGEEPVSVTARQLNTRTNIYRDVDEEMHFELKFPSGIVATCRTSFARGLNDLEVTCEKGWYKLSPFQSYGGVQGMTSTGTKLPPDPSNQQARQMDNDSIAIMKNKTPVVPGEEGLKDIHIVEGIFESSRKEGARVQL